MLYLILLLVLVDCQGLDFIHHEKYEEYPERHDHYSRKHHNQHHHQKYLDYDHNYINHEYIIRPCLLHDMKCISNYFKNISMCSYGAPAKNPYIIKKSSMNAPHANFTFTINNAELRGLESGKIMEFFYNKKTDTLVFEVEFQTLIVDSPKSVVTYYRKGREPFEVADYSFIDFKNTSLTLTIKNLHHPHLIRTHVFGYLSDVNLPTGVGPHFADSKVLTKMKMKWIGHIGLSAVEAMVEQASVYMSAYLHSQICDFKHP